MKSDILFTSWKNNVELFFFLNCTTEKVCTNENYVPLSAFLHILKLNPPAACILCGRQTFK